MILTCNFEEVTALTNGARAYLSEPAETGAAVVATVEARGAVEALLSQLTGDLSIRTLAEQRQLTMALRAVVDVLRDSMETRVLDTHPASEDAVGAYFEYAHAFAVLNRVTDMGEEMSALVEVITGSPPDEAMIREFVFPD